MKPVKYRPAIIFTLLAILGSASLWGQQATKSYREVFPLTGHAALEIENRYGNIDIRNHDANEISIEVEVTVTHRDRETAERQLSYINIDFSQKANDIKALTVIDQRASRQFLRLFSTGTEETQIRINYTVFTPAGADLKITHRYGNVFINEARGHTYLDLRYGNLQANRIIRDNTRPLSEINLAYSTKATINESDWLKLNLRYSDVTVTRARALVISSSYSKLRVDNASSIVAESRYGEFNLGQISNFITESSYTNYTIDEVSSTLDVQTRYGNVRVNRIPADFTKLRFEGSYGNMRAGLDPGASFRVEASGSYGRIDIPSGNRVSRETSGTTIKISGIVGTAADPRAQVEISTRYGNVDLTAR
jgi:hypothetical protein